jgi:GNAT superfamily N-acetyltransferase
MPVLIKKLLRNFNDYGVYMALRKSLLYFLRPVYTDITYRIYRIDVGAVELPPVQGNAFDFKVITANDDAIIRQIEGMEEWLRGRVSAMIASSGICLVALDQGIVAGFNLVSFDEGCLLLVDFSRKLKKNEAWSQQITVKRDYRGRGLATALRYRVIEELQGRGFARLYGGSQISNEAGLGLARKVGFREIADLRYRRFFFNKEVRYRRIKNEHVI